ncbi:MAG: Lpg1974 family pore-forming outer membrane protein [Planctomycetota bacterium]
MRSLACQSIFFHGLITRRALVLWFVLCFAGATSNAVAQNQFQINPYQQQTLPTPIWSVTPPATPDYTVPGASVDHQSMSPDSWSAPSTPITVMPNRTVNQSSTNAFNPAGTSDDSNQFEPDLNLSNNRPTKSDNGSFAASPSIPTLIDRSSSSTLSTESGRSILRQGMASSSDSPFLPSKFSREEKGALQLNGPATNEFDSATILNGELSSVNSAPSQRQQTGPGSMRYPLGHTLSEVQTSNNRSLNPSTFSQPPTQPQQVIQSQQLTTPGIAGPTSSIAQPQSIVPFQQPAMHQSMFGAAPKFRPDLGHRNPGPTIRNPGSWDNGETFDFEDKKKEYPPLSEILATGRYFGSASLLYLQPSFQTNTAITTVGPGVGQSEAFDFDYETAPHIRLGFESKYGPGLELTYWQYDETSNPANFVSNGIVTGEASTWMMGPHRWSRLVAANAGEQLIADHSIDVETISAMFFKEIKFPISRLNGSFGFQYVSIAQSLDASLIQGGTTIGRLNSRSDMRAYGPRFLFEYYRPIGHTKFEFITRFGGSVMFGERDQFVENSVSGDFSRVGADEFLTTTEFYSGIQFKKMVAENRGYYARLGFQYQAWHGGGTAVDAQDDFGLRGFEFSVGYNR